MDATPRIRTTALHPPARRALARLRARRWRRLVEATPRRRASDLTGVARATVVGSVADVVGEGPAIGTWTCDRTAVRSVRGRVARPFTLDDGTGTVRVRVPPGGGVLVGGDDCRDGVQGDQYEARRDEARRDEARRDDSIVTVDEGDRVSVTGRVVRGRGSTPTLTGPKFAVVAPP